MTDLRSDHAEVFVEDLIEQRRAATSSYSIEETELIKSTVLNLRALADEKNSEVTRAFVFEPEEGSEELTDFRIIFDRRAGQAPPPYTPSGYKPMFHGIPLPPETASGWADHITQITGLEGEL